MRYEFFIALRYLRARRRQAAVSIITAIAIIGLAVGVAALIVAQAMIKGFRGEVQERILQGTAHINLLRDDNGGIDDYRAVTEKMRRIAGVKAAAATSYAPVLITRGERQEQAVLKGVDTEAPSEANELFSTAISGDPRRLADPASENASPGIFLGKQLARVLGVELGDTITTISARSRLTPLGVQSRPHYAQFRVLGIFSSGLYEYDAKWGYVSLPAAQELVGNGESAGVIQMKVENLNDVGEIAGRIREAMGSGYVTTTWQELNRPLFAALQLQHRVIVIFFALLIAVAALNIITSLTMMVIEKTRDIAILRAQGATPGAISRIFLLQGAIIGAVGSGLGLLLGVLIGLLANRFRLISLPEEIYAVSSITLRLDWSDCLQIVLLTLLTSLLATLYPSRAASRLTPVEALRYE